METRASYILVGGFVLGLIAVGFAFVIWLTRVDFEEPNRYLVYFTGSVTGLGIGSPVRYRGVPIGTVTEISIDTDNVERIRVALDVTPQTPIKVDTVATLGMQGLTGVAFIQLTGGTQASPSLRPEPDKNLPIIPSRPSGLETVLEKAPELFEKVVIVADRLSRLVDDRNLESVSAALDNIRVLTETLATRRDSLARLFEASEATMVSVRDVAHSVKLLSDDLRGKSATVSDGMIGALNDSQAALKGIRGTATAIERMVKKLDLVVTENRQGLRDFSGGGLYELSLFVSEARVLVAALTRLSAQIERDPSRFFFGDTQKGFEAR